MSEIKNIPRLRFHHYQVEWETKLIGDVCEIGNGRDYKHLNEGDIPVYGTGGVMCYVDDFLHDGQSVGIGRKGSIDKPVLLDDKFWTVDTLFYTKSFLGVIPRFLFEIFNRIPWRIHNEGSGVPSLSQKTIKSLKISIPSLPEQQKIADFLTLVDKRIELIEKKKTLLETYKKGVMKKIFNQEIRFKDDNGSDFPDWEEKKLGDITNKKSSNISANSIESNEGNYTIYGATGELKEVDFFEMNTPYISIVKDGSGVGRVKLCKPYSSVLGTLDIITNNETSDLNFIYQFLTKTSFLKFVTGSSIPHIYYKDYSKLKLSVPSIKEQEKISKFMSSIDSQIELLETQIDKSKTWKKGLLQKMFV